MCMYKIQYEIHDGDKKVEHSRYYHAVNQDTAKEMLEETWREGSLVGYPHPEITEISEVKSFHKKEKQEQL